MFPVGKFIIRLSMNFVFMVYALQALPSYAFAHTLKLPPSAFNAGIDLRQSAAVMKGMTLNNQNPFQLKFIIDPGNKALSKHAKREQYERLMKYFLASLTIPNKDMWVNLSPYEKNRIITEDFGQTAMGRDLLVQDYILKQITAGMIYPQEALGKKFWERIYREAAKRFGSTNIPVNNFNKVWIVPDKAEVYEKNGTALITSSHLKVMLEEDYLALDHNRSQPGDMWLTPKGEAACPQARCQANQQLGVKITQGNNQWRSQSAQIIRDIVLPELEKEVNTGENFTGLRQIYSAMLMATWFKKTLRKGILGQAYVDQSKITGIALNNNNAKHKIYTEYLKAFKKGAFNFIKEDVDSLTKTVIPRKYFAGGMTAYDERMITAPVPASVHDFAQSVKGLDVITVALREAIAQNSFGANINPRIGIVPVMHDPWIFEDIVMVVLELLEQRYPDKEIRALLNAVHEEQMVSELRSIVQLAVGMSSYMLSMKKLLKYWETSPDKRNLLFHTIDIDAMKSALKQLPQGSAQMAEQQMDMIKEILKKIRALNGWNRDNRFQGVHEASPGNILQTDSINCLGRATLMAIYLEALGVEFWGVNVYAYTNRKENAEHVLLLAKLSDGRYFWVEPSEPISGTTERSHVVPIAINDTLNFSKGVTVNLKGADPDYDIVHIAPWQNMMFAGFYNNLGLHLEKIGDDAGAVFYHHQAIKLFPSFFEAYVNLGFVLYKLGDWVGARDAYTKALALNPEDGVAWLNLEGVLRRMSDNQGQLDLYKRYRPKVLRSPYYLLRSAFNRGVVLRNLSLLAKQKNQEKKAEKLLALAEHWKQESVRIEHQTRQYFIETLDEQPENAKVWIEYDDFLTRMEKHEERIVLYTQRKRPQSLMNPVDRSITENNLGVVLALLGRKEEAEQAYRRAMEFNPNNDTANRNLSIFLNNLRSSSMMPKDSAMKAPGGIDFNDALVNMHMRTRNSLENGIAPVFDKKDMNIPGLIPVILKITHFDPQELHFLP